MVMLFHGAFNFFICCFVQCTETKECSLIHGLLCTCTSIQRSKTDFYVLTLRTFVIKQIYIMILVFMCCCITIFNKNVKY
jgi:hypothetical protein